MIPTSGGMHCPLNHYRVRIKFCSPMPNDPMPNTPSTPVLGGRGRAIFGRCHPKGVSPASSPTRKPTRRVTHPRAVQTSARSPNPEALTKYPVLTGSDLILVGYSRVADTPKRRHEQRQRVLEAATDLAEPVTMPPKQVATDRRCPALLRAEVLGDGSDVGLQLMPTDEYLTVHAARWAARQHAFAN